MDTEPENRINIQKYLLGGMDVEERERVEERYFNSDAFLEEMLVVEDELLEAYVRGELYGEDLALFEEQYLTSAWGRKRVAFTRALLKLAAKSSATDERASSNAFGSLSAPPSSVALPRWLAYAAAGLAIAFGVAIVQIVRLNGKLSQVREQLAASERLRDDESKYQRDQLDQLTAELEKAQSSAPESRDTGKVVPGTERDKAGAISPPVADRVLIARLLRSEASPVVLSIPIISTILRLRVNIESPGYETYTVIVRQNGDELFHRDGLKPHRIADETFIFLEMPISRLSTNRSYQLTVSGIDKAGTAEQVGVSRFSIVKVDGAKP